MRIIQTVKQLNEWQLTQQDSGKTWALLPFLNGLPRESNTLAAWRPYPLRSGINRAGWQQ